MQKKWIHLENGLKLENDDDDGGGGDGGDDEDEDGDEFYDGNSVEKSDKVALG